MKKRIFSIVLTLVIIFSAILFTGLTVFATPTEFTDYAGGKGTVDEPFQIATKSQLEKFATDVNGGNSFRDKYFVLTGNIGENDAFTDIIGTGGKYFDGHFDGKGYAVMLNINLPDTYNVGLFGVLGYHGEIKNVTVSGRVNGKVFVGGVCGGSNGTIINCINTCEINGTYIYVGGVCGYSDGIIINCSNTGKVCGINIYVGGVCGGNNGTVANCLNIGNVSGTEYCSNIGGICGNNSGMTVKGRITNCFNAGDVSATNGNVGGVCGYSEGTIDNCYNTGNVNGDKYDGGVCGQNQGSIINCYNTGNVSGTDESVGGVCGYNKSTITDCYCTSTVYHCNPVGLGGAVNSYDFSTTQMTADSETQDALIDKLNGYKDLTEAYPEGYLVWVKDANGYPYLPGHVECCAGANGTLTLNSENPVKYNGADFYKKGETVKLTVAADDGYAITSVKFNGKNATKVSDGKYSFVMPEGHVTVTAEFDIPSVPEDKPDVKSVTSDDIVCKLCSVYLKMKDVPFIGIFCSIAHFICHFVTWINFIT